MAPVHQQSMVWCWVASGEMIFKHFNVPTVNPASYQCGVVAFLGAPYTSCMQNCGTCQVPAHDISMIQNMLEQYPVFAGRSLGRYDQKPIHSKMGSDLTAKEVRKEIENGRPILIGLSPSGHTQAVPEHAAVIVGYRVEGDDDGEETWVIVNDPFPYEAFLRGEKSPYERAGGARERLGQYSIEIDDLRSKLGWTQSLYGLSQDDDSPLSLGDDDDDGASGESCKKRCKKRKEACVERAQDALTNCTESVRSNLYVRQCNCPNWPIGNFQCEEVCRQASGQSLACAEIEDAAEETCKDEKRDCLDGCD